MLGAAEVEEGAERAAAVALAHGAYHDPLTSLGNRSLLVEHLNRSLSSERLRPVAVVLLDLDDFEQVNDAVGPDGADQLLRQVAGCLSASPRWRSSGPSWICTTNRSSRW